MSSERYQRANAIIESMEGAEPHDVDHALAQESLPSLVELGKMQVTGGVSFARLHRRLRKLEKRLERKPD